MLAYSLTADLREAIARALDHPDDRECERACEALLIEVFSELMALPIERGPGGLRIYADEVGEAIDAAREQTAGAWEILDCVARGDAVVKEWCRTGTEATKGRDEQ